MSTQFLRIQKNQLIDLKQHLETYVNTLPLFGFNSGRYDLNLIKSYLLPYLLCDKEIDPTVIKKSKLFHIIHFWKCSVSGHNEVSWRRNNIGFVSEGLQSK